MSLVCGRVFVAGLFQGIPQANVSLYPVDAAHDGAHLLPLHCMDSLNHVSNQA